jgi:DNA-binding MarR family transcriptional regulator
MMSEMSPNAIADPLGNLLGYQLRRLSSAMMADLGTSLAPAGLRPVEATILILIEARSGCTQSDIGRTLGIARANMAPLMAGLMRQGWVEKSPVDGRSQALSLTSLGRLKAVEAQTIVNQHEERFQARLNAGERERLLSSLRSLLA